MRMRFVLGWLAAAVLAVPTVGFADGSSQLSNGQTIYVPAYSHIYVGDKEKPFLLTVTVSIRNVDLTHKIRVKAVDYYETQGKLVKKHVDKTVVLNPLESLRYVIPQTDAVGGSGANFIVVWEADEFVNPPIAESVMIGTQQQQGVSFTSRGRAIVTTKP